MCFSKKKSLILKQTSNLSFILDWLMRKPPSSKQDGRKRTRVAGQHFLQLHCRYHCRTSRRIFRSQYPTGLLQTLRSPRIAHSGNLQGEHIEEKSERGKMQLKITFSLVCDSRLSPCSCEKTLTVERRQRLMLNSVLTMLQRY